MPRRKKDGDRFRPTWRDRPAKLKDFLRGQGVPLHRREEVALICDQRDVVSLFPWQICAGSTGRWSQGDSSPWTVFIMYHNGDGYCLPPAV